MREQSRTRTILVKFCSFIVSTLWLGPFPSQRPTLTVETSEATSLFIASLNPQRRSLFLLNQLSMTGLRKTRSWTWDKKQKLAMTSLPGGFSAGEEKSSGQPLFWQSDPRMSSARAWRSLQIISNILGKPEEQHGPPNIGERLCQRNESY